MDIETMRVKCPVTEDNDQGFYVINKEDFDPEKHEPIDALTVADVKVEVAPSWQNT